MYAASKPPLKDVEQLDQGDVLADVPRPKETDYSNVVNLTGKNQFLYKKDGLPAETVGTYPESLRLVVKVERTPHALVLSNSCDNASGKQGIVLAPVRRFDFRGETDPVEQWRRVSQAATGTANPKLFYLAASPCFGIERSQVALDEMYVVSPEVLGGFIKNAGLRRVCGLADDAVLHLQWQIASLFGRHPRHDDGWPSDEDIELKIAAYRMEIAKGKDFDGSRQREIDRLAGRGTAAQGTAEPRPSD